MEHFQCPREMLTEFDTVTGHNPSSFGPKHSNSAPGYFSGFQGHFVGYYMDRLGGSFSW